MQLENKNAVIYGAAGALGGAVARGFAREGARVFLVGRTKEPLEAVAAAIAGEGGIAEIATVNALDEQAVADHILAVVSVAGHLDVSFNMISHGDVHGVPLVDISAADFDRPISTAVTTNFITARTAARQMIDQGSGVILTLTSPPAKMVGPLMGGTGVAEAAVETFTRCLAAEVGTFGVRVLGLRSDGIPEAWAEDWHTNVFDSPIEWQESGGTEGLDPVAHARQLADQTMLRRTPTLADLAAVAVFLASDRAAALTGTITNMTCGSVAD